MESENARRVKADVACAEFGGVCGVERSDVPTEVQMHATVTCHRASLPNEDYERLLVLLFGEDAERTQAVAA